MTNGVSVKNWVALDLTNTSTSSEVVSLLKLPDDFSSGTATSASVVGESLGSFAGATNGMKPMVWCPTNNSIYYVRYSSPFDVDIYVYNAATNTLVTTILTGLAAFQVPADFYYHPTTDRIYATTRTGNVYLKINPTNNTFTTIASAINPTFFAYEPANNSLYCGGTTGQIEVLSLASDTITNTFASPLGTVEYALTMPVENKIYMADNGGRITSVNTSSDTINITYVTAYTDVVVSENGLCEKENLIYIHSGASGITTGVATIDYVTETTGATIATTLPADSVDYFFEENIIFISDTAGTRMRVFDCTDQSFIQEVSGGGFSAQFSLIIGNKIFNAGAAAFKVLDMPTKTYIRNDAYSGGVWLINTETFHKIFSSSSGGSVTLYIYTSAPFLVGTSTSIIVESGIGYDALVAELNNGYYELTDANVYADNINQANQWFRINDRYVSGKSYKDYDYPAVPPTRPQFVTIDIPLNFNPKSPKILQYKMNGLQSIRLIIKYKTILTNVNDMPDKYLINESLQKIDPVENYLPQSQIPFLNGKDTTVDFTQPTPPMQQLTIKKRINIKDFMSKFI